MKERSRGWITAEYGMLPRSTHDRMSREASRGKQGGQTLNSAFDWSLLHSAVDLDAMGEFTITIDCDVFGKLTSTRIRPLLAHVLP